MSARTAVAINYQYAWAYWETRLWKRPRRGEILRTGAHMAHVCTYYRCRAERGAPCVFPGQDNSDGKMVHQPRMSTAINALDAERKTAFLATYEGTLYAEWRAANGMKL